MLQELKALPVQVLIESDWNLKEVAATYLGMDKGSINRIRLEFKAVPVTAVPVTAVAY